MTNFHIDYLYEMSAVPRNLVDFEYAKCRAASEDIAGRVRISIHPRLGGCPNNFIALQYQPTVEVIDFTNSISQPLARHSRTPRHGEEE